MANMQWNFIENKLRKGIPILLMTVVESRGSSPGRPGFKLAFSQDGEWKGSVGGGKLEHHLLSNAHKYFDKEKKVVLKKFVHEEGEGPESSGMICAGSQHIAIVTLEKQDLSHIEAINHSANGQMILSDQGLKFEDCDVSELKQHPVFTSGENWLYQESIGFDPKLYIFGGGHIGLALSRLFKELNFHIIVLDDRTEEIKTIKENDFAHEVRQINYAKAEDHVEQGLNKYVIIATASHESDGLILEQMLSKKLRYLGMLGSRKKVHHIKNVLKKVGWKDEELEKVDAPIGLEINSQTPAEIAVSIAAKIIKVKNET